MSSQSQNPASERQVAGPAFCDAIDNFVRRLGSIFAWSNAFLVAVIILQVVLRYGFGKGLVVLEELQWHLYAVGIMFGLSYAMAEQSHIRVDIIHMRLSPRAKAVLEIFGIVVFLIPFIYVVIDHSLPFVYESWRLGESSDAPTGLPFRWAVKSIIPLSFSLLALTTLTRLVRSIASLRGKA